MSAIILHTMKIKEFFNFMNERHTIFQKRADGKPWPWTKDKILQTYKFTNVFRELDTGTVWLRKNIREPYKNDPELYFNIAAYRRYNYWPAAEVIGYIHDYSPKAMYNIIRRIRDYHDGGGQVFTGAHMLNCAAGVDKITHVFEMVLPEVWEHRRELEPKQGDTLESSFNKLMTVKGYGPFISYEVITDLRHTRYLENATDIMTWANPGPGAMRGIQRMMGLEISNEYGHKAPPDVRAQYPNREGYIDTIRYLLSVAQEFGFKWYPILEMRDIEHSLCEWDKYERTRTGEGRPRSKFNPIEKGIKKQV